RVPLFSAQDGVSADSALDPQLPRSPPAQLLSRPLSRPWPQGYICTVGPPQVRLRDRASERAPFSPRPMRSRAFAIRLRIKLLSRWLSFPIDTYDFRRLFDKSVGTAPGGSKVAVTDRRETQFDVKV